MHIATFMVYGKQNSMNGEDIMPMIGAKAPDFKAITTNGKINFPVDYLGKWVVLFSHPADFTPVCTTEFIAFSRIQLPTLKQ